MSTIRRAGPGDLEQLLVIAAERRRTYATFQPRFWRPAPDAVDRQRSYLRSVLEDEASVVVLATGEAAEIRGFAIGRLVPAPPVYAPGGPVCMVDDFALVDPDEWQDAGRQLLAALRDWAADRGAIQVVVVTAHLDELKRTALEGSGLTLASEWWVGPVG